MGVGALPGRHRLGDDDRRRDVADDARRGGATGRTAMGCGGGDDGRDATPAGCAAHTDGRQHCREFRNHRRIDETPCEL